MSPLSSHELDPESARLIEDGARLPDLLVDQGTADGFLESQLKPDLLRAAFEAGELEADEPAPAGAGERGEAPRLQPRRPGAAGHEHRRGRRRDREPRKSISPA